MLSSFTRLIVHKPPLGKGYFTEVPLLDEILEF